jgi:hypothetical protein
MAEQPVGRFLTRVKDWKIRNMVAGYLKARRMFLDTYSQVANNTFISFEQLLDLCEVLFVVKEDHHLLFRRLIRPRSREFDSANKFTPSDVEIAFMNNVGLLFHKAMVAREVKYVIEHYEEESDDAAQRWKELHLYLKELDRLFNVGLRILTEFIRLHRENVLLMSYLLEESNDAIRAYGKKGESLLALFVNGSDLPKTYERVGRYYLESGWPKRARRILERLLQIEPENRFAQDALVDLDARRVA